MAETRILNPNDQPTGKWRLLHKLRACLGSDDYDAFLVAVAFARTGPLLRLQGEIEQWLAKGKKISGIFGINHRNTSKQALQFALDRFTKAHVLFHSDEFTYHPKMYLFIGQPHCRFFIGSHNLTVGGTETNWESGIEMALHLPGDKAMLEDAITAWDALLKLSTELNSTVIEQYDALGKLADESVRQWRRSPSRPILVAGMPVLPGPLRPEVTIKPPSPLPVSLFAVRPTKRVPLSRKARPVTRAPRRITAEALVIQIVPHPNGEVFLSKRAINQNPDFFGFPFTGRTTPKKPSNPSYPQRIPDPIVDLTVYDRGKNPVVHLPRLALNTVFYEKKSEIRITVPPEVVRNTPHYSILVMRQAPDAVDFDYEMEIFSPRNPQFGEYLAVCNQVLPSGGKDRPRRMGWL